MEIVDALWIVIPLWLLVDAKVAIFAAVVILTLSLGDSTLSLTDIPSQINIEINNDEVKITTPEPEAVYVEPSDNNSSNDSTEWN